MWDQPVDHHLMIYARRPDATACATYELWNDIMRRYIRRGVKGDRAAYTRSLRYGCTVCLRRLRYGHKAEIRGSDTVEAV